ncbi:MAG TPA: hypothetical protein VGB55_04750 [Tepidisphaeraceae bacterium]|jgi:hypothetical protein
MLLNNLLMVVASTVSVAAAPASIVPTTGFGPELHAVIRPVEVRMRRLHMVRPDLIRFPIVYDTIC